MKAAINASPLIFLAKLDMLSCLRIYENIYTTQLVLEEIEKGMDKGFTEVLSIKKLINKKFILVKKFKGKKGGLNLHPGELSVIELAKKIAVDELIVDDKNAISAAKYFGLKVVSTPYLLLKNLMIKRIDLDTFKIAMNRLIDFGYYISPNLYVKLLEKADDLSEK
jgi:predicted nucleic acid-binding protein